MENNFSVLRRTDPRIWILLVLISILVVIIFYFPNAQASENLSMVQMFEPDEEAPYPYLIRMISPSEGLKEALYKFVFYEYYYYGFPHFALSAISLLPLKWTNQLTNTSLVFLTLRQVVSLVPILIGLLLLVYMQDGFRTYRSPILYIFLLSIPAVVRNNFWWHPDGLVVLISSLILFLLWKDNLRFSWHFFSAAVFTGVLAATKIVGVYYFLAVGLSLIGGVVLQKISLRKSIGMGLSYIGLMAISFIAANPFLLSKWGRIAYRYILNKETELLSDGYAIFYEKGISAAWTIAKDYYGWGIFILIAVGVTIWGIFKGPQKYLFALILAWFLPLTISLIYITHFKFQYWLPVALPLISCIVILLPDKLRINKGNRLQSSIRFCLLLLIIAQFVAFIVQDMKAYSTRYHREENNERIAFYDTAVDKVGSITKGDLHVYRDYRLYVPATDGWSTETSFEMLDYNYIQSSDFDVLLLLEQRIKDYINPNVTGIDAEQFARSFAFYTDANNGNLQGYQLLYRDDVALVFMKDALITH